MNGPGILSTSALVLFATVCKFCVRFDNADASSRLADGSSEGMDPQVVVVLLRCRMAECGRVRSAWTTWADLTEAQRRLSENG